jgi:NAD+ synthetase
MRLTLAQLNPTVGDVAGNARLVIEACEQAVRDGADAVVTTELCLIGYPPRDLVFRKGVVEACEQAAAFIARQCPDIVAVVGHPRRCPRGTRPFCNSLSVCAGGRVARVYDKRLLPGYDVFDEDRYFEPGRETCVIEVAGRRLGLMICEDFWRAQDVTAETKYVEDPVQETVDAGCDAIAMLNATPFIRGKWERHVTQIRAAAARHRLPIVSVHQVGANDDLIFDGRSVAVDGTGSPLAVLPGWQPAVLTIDLPRRGAAAAPALPRDVGLEVDPVAELFHALVLGTRDYVAKTGHEKVLVGLSGGIDSSLTACLAAAALGPGNVIGLMMSSRYSSAASVEDAMEVASNLGLARCEDVPIRAAHQAVGDTLAPVLGAAAAGVVDENVQARLRAVIIMAWSNATGALVLVPSNKSELAAGYATIYGDMSGALAVLGDVVKTRVYAIAEWINAHFEEAGFDRPPIPERVFTKPPSAELRPDQTDQDTLPPYDILDQIVERSIEREQSVRQIIEETGLDPGLVRGIARMIDRAQFKRDQFAPVLKVTPRAFGRGRPMPIAMRWDEGAKLSARSVGGRAPGG